MLNLYPSRLNCLIGLKGMGVKGGIKIKGHEAKYIAECKEWEALDLIKGPEPVFSPIENYGPTINCPHWEPKE